MKNYVIVLFLVAICLSCSVFAKKEDKKWTKINNYIYIDKSSIKKLNNSTTALIKLYNSPDRQIRDIEGNLAHYEIVQYEAYCKSNVLFINHFKYYNKNDELFSDEINNHNVGGDCKGYIDGEIICRAICGD